MYYSEANCLCGSVKITAKNIDPKFTGLPLSVMSNLGWCSVLCFEMWYSSETGR